MQIVNSITALFYKEYKMAYKNLYDILTIILFFLLGIFIFTFSIGPNNEIFQEIGVGIIWTLLLLSNNLSIKKFYQNDFTDGNLHLLHMSGMSYELIVLVKLIANWFFLQIPFFIFIPLACVILNIQNDNIYLILLTFLIGSPILTSIASISGSLNLLNNRNIEIASIIVMLLSIPVIIFSFGIIKAPPELIKPQLSFLIGILLLFTSTTPWICAGCIKIAIKNS